MRPSAPTLSAGLALGFLADLALGDPRRWHPVAGFGRLAAALERRCYRPSRAAGTAYATALVAGAAVLGSALQRRCRHPVARTGLVAAATWAVLGGESLRREAMVVSAQLHSGDLEAARTQIRNLVGRDPTGLDEPALVRACVESVAENTSDAVVAPLVWGAVAGVPGLLAYRALNTLDAMVGHVSPRYRRFGWAAARLDDAANWLPARLAAWSVWLAAPVLGGSRRATWRAVRRDAGQHPSPNAGVVEAAFAGALGIRLGGTNTYGGSVSHRGTLGDGRPAETTDIARAARLSMIVSAAALGVAVAVGLAGRSR